MKEDETRVYNDKNAYLNNAEDETVKAETTVSEDETAMAPEAAKKTSAKGNNAAFAAAGAVAGAAVGAGVSAAAMKHGDSKFTKEADAEVKPEEEVAVEAKDEAKSDEELLNAPADEKGGETPAIGHTSGTPVAEAPAAEVTPVATEDPETEVHATEVQPVQVNVTVNINGAPAETGEVKTVVPEPEVEVHSVGTIMDEEGNVVNHAEVTVDGVDAVLLDVDNNGTIDVAIVDSDGDGQVTIEDAMDMSDTGLTMDDVAQHMMGQDDQMPDDTMI